MPAQQLSPKSEEGQSMKGNLFLLDTFQVARMAKHCSGTEVRGVNSGKHCLEKCIFCKRVLQKYLDSPVRM